MLNSWSKSALIVIVVACLAASCAPPATPPTPAPPPVVEKPTQRPTTRPVNTKPAKTPKPEPTATPRGNSIELEWTIETGDIRYLGAAKDGTLYGITRADSRTGLKYVVISPKGEVAKLLDIPEAQACNDGFMHREDFRNRQTYTVLPDGTLVCHSRALLRIAPDGTPTLTEPWSGSASITGANTFFVNNDGMMRFYDIKGQLINEVQLPENYEFWQGRFYAEDKDFVFLTHDGQIVRFPIPEGLNLQERFSTALLPWDDLYLTYRANDAIGNFTGEKTLKVGPDGRVTTLAMNPWRRRYEGAYVPLPFVFYSPDRVTIYAIDDAYWRKLALINRDNKTLRIYEFPKEVNLGDAFVGNDGAVYVWSRSLQGKPQLSKYALTN